MAIASFDLGNATVTAADTIVIPLGANVPRSDPTDGATLILVSVLCADNVIDPEVTGVTDDGDPDGDFYGACIFSDGLNHYSQFNLIPENLFTGGYEYVPSVGWFGLILNDLTTANSLTIQLNGTVAWAFAFARAYTGVLLDTSGVPSGGGFPTSNADWLFDGSFGSEVVGPVGFAVDDDAGASGGIVSWGYGGSGGSLRYTNPGGVGGCTDGNWTWQLGALAIYAMFVLSNTGSGARTWDDTDIAAVDEFDDINAGLGAFTVLQTIVVAEQAITAPQTGISVAGSWATGLDNHASVTIGAGTILQAGVGPTCPAAPPTGNPVFNNHIRLSE